MLFICYFEILPEKIEEVTSSTLSHSTDDGPQGIRIIFEGVSASHWGIAAFEADSEEDVFRFIRPWASLNNRIQVAPALRVDDGDYARRLPAELRKDD